MSDGKKVAVLMGGPSDEHDVSLNSGRQVLSALQKSQESIEVVIERDGHWRVAGETLSAAQAIGKIVEQCDAVFIALHGPFGEDGLVQGLLEVFNLSYTGSAVLASALAMDKIKAKILYRAHDLPTPLFVSFSANTELNPALLDKAVALGFPSVVKPARLGSSFGILFVQNPEQLRAHVQKLTQDGHDVLVEENIEGREVTCGILENAAEKTVTPLPITEIIPGEKYAYFDYEAKYTPGATQELTPADLPEPVAKQIRELALVAHRAIGCRDMSRTDFLLRGEALEPLLIETNTIPGFTETSLLPQEAAAAGIDFAQLVNILVQNARHRITQSRALRAPE